MHFTGGTSPYTFTKAYGTLPPGLTIDPALGTISGTPTTAGSYTFALGVIDQLGAYAEREYSIEVTAPFIMASATLPRGTVGVNYVFSPQLSGGKTPYYFDGPLNISAGFLTSAGAFMGHGVPSTAGTYLFSLSATDASGRTASQSYTIAVDAALTNTTTRPNDGIVGSVFNQTLTATGGLAPYTWGIYSGTLPAGLTLNPATGIISGTPTSATTQPVVISVQDSYGRVVYNQFNINVLNPLQILTSTLPNGSQNNTYSEAIRTNGGIGPYSFALTGQLPAGLTISATTGIISGTPTATGLNNLQVTVTDSSYPTAQTKTQTLSARVTSSVTITTNAVITNAKKGVAITPVTLVAKGGVPGYTWAITGGALPSGMTLDPASGILSGTPTDRGDFTFTVRVTDSVGNATGPTNSPPNPDKQFYIHISDTLSVTTGAVPNGATGLPYNAVLSATGGLKNYSWAVKTGTLPAGLSLTAATGAIGGTPTANITSSVTFEVTDSDAPAQKAQVSLIFVVTDTLSIYEGSVPNSRINQAYTANVRAQLGTPPYTWSIPTGTLPAGVTLAQNAGAVVLSGTPTTAGTSSFTLQVSDNGTPVQTVSRAFSATVYPDVAISTAGLKTAVRGTPYSDSVAATGGLLPYTYTITAGTLPSGLTFNSTTGAITGSVTMATGTSATFTVTVTDSGYPAASVSKDFTIMAIDPLVINTSVIQGALQKSSYSAALNGTGGVAPLSWSVASGSLPQGISINATSGTISGTSVPCGTFNFTVQLADNATVSTTVQQAMQLAVTCSNDYVISGNAGIAGASVALGGAASKTVTADGSGNYSIGPLASGNYTVTPTKYQYIFTPTSKSVTVNNLDTQTTAFTASQDATPPVLTVVPADNTLTNNAALTVSGAATDAGGIQSVSVNGTSVTVSQADGSFTKVITLAAGANSITVIATDKAGNQTTITRTVILDTTPPTLSVSPADNTLTNNATLTVSGIATDTNGIQSVTINGATVTVSQTDGSYSKAVTLIAGANSITVIATDKAGNLTTLTRTVTLDTTPPSVTVTPADGTYTNNASLTVSGTATDTNGIQSVTVNGAAVTVNQADGSFSKAITLAAGANTVTVIATDKAGNQTTITRTATLDTTPPAVTVIPADATYTNNAALTVSGTATDAGGIQSVTVNGAAVTVNQTDGSFSKAVTLVAGANSITVIATDKAGNQATVTRTVTLDTTPPALTVSPADNTFTDNASVTVSGTATDASGIQSVTVNGTAVTVSQADGSFSKAITLNVGANSITVIATDKAGNQTTVARTVTLDTTPPTLSVSPADNTLTNTAALTVSGTATDASGIQSVTVNGTVVTVSQTDGSFSKAITLTAGANSIVVIATDKAGNQSTVTRTVTLDTTPPALTVSPADNTFTNNASVTVSGTATDANGIQSATINGAAVTVNQTDGSFSKTKSLPSFSTSSRSESKQLTCNLIKSKGFLSKSVKVSCHSPLNFALII